MDRCIMAICLTVVGCSISPIAPSAPVATQQPTAVTSVIATPVPAKVEPKPTFPPEFLELAEVLSMYVGTDPNNIQQDESLHTAYQGLMTLKNLKTSDSNIAYIIQLASTALTDGLQAAEKLKSLPQPQSGESALVESIIAGYFGDVRHGMNLGSQIQQAREEIRVEIEKIKSACERVATANQLLAKAAEKYAVPSLETTAKPQIQIQFEETWWNENDLCRMLNHGPTLNNCIIVVELTGKQGTTRKNVHYVKQWKGGEILYCPYGHGQMVNGKRILSNTVVEVQQVRVTVYSSVKTLHSTFKYTQSDKDEDCREYLSHVKFSHRYQPFVKGIVFNDERTMFVQMTGIAWLPKCKVTLKFINWTQSASCEWELESWMNEETKSFEAKDLKFEPHTVKMSIAVDGYTYVHEVVFSIK